jgi:cytochrome c oxidase subunit 2
MPVWSQFSFQDGVSPTMEEFLIFHDKIVLVCRFTTITVLGTFIFLLSNRKGDSELLQRNVLEWVWTFIPGSLLLFVAIPSITLLYMYDEQINYRLRVKAIGHQWFWSYELARFDGDRVNLEQFDSYIVASDIPISGFRLLDTDSRLVIPMEVPVQVLVTSGDVLHSWAVPCIGVKADAVPGRLNLTSLFRYSPGLYFGQCSEICGANHRFIPIVVEVILIKDYLKWLISLGRNAYYLRPKFKRHLIVNEGMVVT